MAPILGTWGGVSLLIDINVDGLPDYRAHYDGWWSFPSPDDRPVEYWRSTRCDGIFDVHVVFDDEGQLKLVEQDLDRDGDLEAEFRGAEAASRLALQRERDRLAGPARGSDGLSCDSEPRVD